MTKEVTLRQAGGSVSATAYSDQILLPAGKATFTFSGNMFGRLNSGDITLAVTNASSGAVISQKTLNANIVATGSQWRQASFDFSVPPSSVPIPVI